MKTKKEIFRKPLELFVKRGYDHTPMSLLTKELGLCRGGLYHHFPSKESLLFYVIEKLMEERFVPILEESKNISDPEKRLEFFIKAFTKLLTKDDATRIVLHDSKNLKPQHYEKIRRIWRRTYDLIKNTISEMEKSGKINRHNKAFSAFAVIGMCSWTFYWFDYSRKKSAEELGETFVDILLRGLLKRN
jgi:AcrR family transcriptional regulator